MSFIAAPVFVLIWSTGFIVARFIGPHATPELILLLRMSITAAMMAAIAAIGGAGWPAMRRVPLHLGAGALLNGVYLCASWWAVSRGMPAGIMALLGALQPLLVAVAGYLIGERLPWRGWMGLAAGLVGVVMVLQPFLTPGIASAVTPVTLGAAILSIVAMAAGTMIQAGSLKRDGIVPSAAIQNLGGAIVAAIVVWIGGVARWDSSPILWAGLAWSVLALSGAALSLLVWMTRHQGATRVSVLLLLVPPLAAIEGRFLFGERLTILQLIGFALALGGVLLTRVSPSPSPPRAGSSGKPA